MFKATLKAGKRFNRILKRTLGSFLVRKFSMVSEGFPTVQPPYILLANHTNFWDPFLVSVYVPEPVYFVTADEYFRNALLRLLLKLVGAIPKSKFVSDAATVKDIIRVKNMGGVIGIFPEGKRNWNGVTGEILYPTAKLVKSLKIPVVVALLQGAYLSYPRWAQKTRAGSLTITYRKILDAQDITVMSTDEIFAVISRGLAYDETAYQKIHQIPFRGRDLAEDLELYLYICPQCRAIGKLISRGSCLSCMDCNYSVNYNTYGFFVNEVGKLYFETPAAWDVWQSEYLGGLLAIRGEETREPIISDTGVIVKTGERMQRLEKLQEGNLMLYSDRILFTGLTGREIIFNLNGIQGINVQYNNQFEFYYHKTLYRFSFKNRKISAYKWVKAVQIIWKRNGRIVMTD